MHFKGKVPFEYSNQKDFQDKLIEWIGDILYDILPEQGYEVRDEQIYTAFQIADAFCDKKVHLAEAGLGTGKTFAYLLSAIPYARYTGKPVVISCASSALQEQLAAEDGDVCKLSKLLGLEVDARMAKDPTQYVCDVRAESSGQELGGLPVEVNEWIQQTQKGERSEMPTLPDAIWKKIAWHKSMSCESCVNRGYCKLVRARENYRGTQDLLIVDHETFFHDLWTREEKKTRGHMPILPDYSAVIFDEGHKIMLPAALQAGNQLNQEEIEAMVAALEDIQGARNALHHATVELEEACEHFFNQVKASVVPGESDERLGIELTPALLKAAKQLRAVLDQVLMELQIEQELYIEAIPLGLIQAYEGQIEDATQALAALCKQDGEGVLAWMDTKVGDFVVVPRYLTEALHQSLYAKKLPVIFSSATLSNEGNFDYMIRMLGLKAPSKSTIGSPFNLEEQVTLSFMTPESGEAATEKLVSLLEKNGGHALVLTRSLSEVKRLKEQLKDYPLPFQVIYEDEGDRGYLVRKFKEDESSVLVGSSFWEGMDVPGEALTLVVIWQLPFPKSDPLIEAKRKEALEEGMDPVMTVDYPEMGLKLKQGCGRLIRTENDQGEIVFMDQVIGTPWEKIVRGALPKGATIREL